MRLTKYLAAGLLLAAATAANTQTPGASPTATTQGPAARVFRTTESRIAIGRSIHVAYDEEVQDAVVVIGGMLDLGPQAEVRGDAVVVG